MTMNKTVERLLNGAPDNHVLPFFWQHGEDEATLREYMRIIHEAGCGAVCIESRPHPDFCGPKWWADMDIILDEARRRKMKVWILDDSHFPTGYANGKVREAPDSLCRRNIFCNTKEYPGKQCTLTVDLVREGLTAPPAYDMPPAMAAIFGGTPARRFSDDRVFGVTAVNKDTMETLDLSDHLDKNVLCWNKPDGEWQLRVCVISGNTGCRRDYINMLSHDSCRLLLDAVYEPHYEHYKDDFGKTIAGFFSDEPELGNGMIYAQYNYLGTKQDLPWSDELETNLARICGDHLSADISLLWNEGKPEETARMRILYMDEITKLVRTDFSCQIGDWCRSHGVRYIGHVVEDNGQHCRTGSSLGHYFRGLEGQDMSGIDDIGGQVMPQGEDIVITSPLGQKRNGEFYHYGLASLAASAAALEPRKHGNAMCEIFGNYGWGEGVHLEKYLADHFLVRGINCFVPHAFDPKDFPDPDCPPHFYAHGHNPQYRHFGKLMEYINRAATLTSSGKTDVPAAVLYHGESEWMDSSAMPFETPLRVLYDEQISCHVIPSDVFDRREFYHTETGRTLRINGQEYRIFIVPAAEYISDSAARGVSELAENGMPVIFVNRRPENCKDSDGKVVRLEDLAEEAERAGIRRLFLKPENNRVRVLKVQGDTTLYMFTNEAAEVYEGIVELEEKGPCFLYDAWDNCCEEAAVRPADADDPAGRVRIALRLEPMKSRFLILGCCDAAFRSRIDVCGKFSGMVMQIPVGQWLRSTCEGKEYPAFGEERAVSLPDHLAEEQPEFSGYVRYRTTFRMKEKTACRLIIEDASEGVEVFVNGHICGIQIAPPFCYDLSDFVRAGTNELTIEIATTLERECYPMLTGYAKAMAPAPASGSGITGRVGLF